MAIIKLPDHGLSNSASRRSKHWIKRLTSVDTSQSNGYAFVGDFARFGGTTEVPEGTWYLSYVEDVAGSGRLYSRTVTLYRLAGEELVTIETWQLDGSAGWALHCRDAIAAHLAAASEPDIDALLAERERLLARIAEIDAILPEPEGVEMSTRQAAQALGVSVRTVQRWAQAGKVNAAKDSQGRWTITIIINA